MCPPTTILEAASDLHAALRATAQLSEALRLARLNLDPVSRADASWRPTRWALAGLLSAIERSTASGLPAPGKRRATTALLVELANVHRFIRSAEADHAGRNLSQVAKVARDQR
jgi:hypothetical protein